METKKILKNNKLNLVSKSLSMLSLKEKLTMIPALFLRSIFHSAYDKISRLGFRKFEMHDCIKLALLKGNDFECETGADKTTYLLTFTKGEWKDFSFKIRKNSSDLGILTEILIRKEYESLVKRISISQPLDSIEYIVDAGANIGCTTAYFKKIFPKATIIAVEPDDNNFNLLSENIKLNKLENVYPIKAGIWNKSVRLGLSSDFRDGRECSLTVFELDDENSSEGIEAVSLEQIRNKFSMPRIDILKIDIEGAERFLFDTEENSQRNLFGVKYLALEIHDEFGIRSQIEGQLESNGFIQYTINETTVAYNKNLIRSGS
jgi:FkbM family methyltransferase